jgi:hypothetical protein
MLAADRAVFIRYRRDGKRRRGSGLHVGGQFVLTADHCADGTDHEVIVAGHEYPARVHMRSETSDVDIAVLDAAGLPEVDPLGCALVARDVADWLNECVALGYPVWKDKPRGGPRLEQARGDVPTAADIDPFAVAGAVTLMTLKITDPEARGRPTPAGDLDASTLWPGMSGAVVVTPDDLIVGVIRSHNLAEGGQSLTVTPLDAIDTLPEPVSELYWAALHVTDPKSLPRLPVPVENLATVSIPESQLVVGEIPRRANDGEASNVSISPDGRYIATNGRPPRLTVWDARTFRQVAVPLPVEVGAFQTKARFAPDGRLIVTNGTVLRAFTIDPAEWLARACREAGRTLTLAEFDEVLPGRHYRPACA